MAPYMDNIAKTPLADGNYGDGRSVQRHEPRVVRTSFVAAPRDRITHAEHQYDTRVQPAIAEIREGNSRITSEFQLSHLNWHH
ncbi:hypothetical protein X760_22280 [Mesorhizobium sp. LSHC422A00]|nr:hypothetical protein X760_22280 [Mesorhizobium sp. LSHC422A00]